MKKSDIEMHSAHMGFPPFYPAVNVKMYRGHGTYPPTATEVAQKFGCSEKQAEKALDFWFNGAQSDFWNSIVDAVKELYEKYRYKVEVYSAGRCGGWLIVKGLPEIESWDAILVGKWASVIKICRDDIAYRCSKEAVFEDIESNEWWKDGSEQYNFVDGHDGSKCIADLKKAAREAGFGAVVR